LYRLYCFFFQVEDGIRVLHVTGVQTCALPILAAGEEDEAAAGGGERFFAARRFQDPTQDEDRFVLVLMDVEGWAGAVDGGSIDGQAAAGGLARSLDFGVTAGNALVGGKGIPAHGRVGGQRSQPKRSFPDIRAGPARM